MSEFKKILVALSFADLSKSIFSSAAKLAEGLDADLIVLNVINIRDVEAVQTISSMGYEVDGDHYTRGIEEERKAFLENIVRETSFPASRVQIVFRVGNPIDEILKTAVKENVDMIAMGPKGKTNLEHVFIGSVAEKVFRRSPFTVVSFRDEEYAERLKKRIQT